jgi:hypothetical protein
MTEIGVTAERPLLSLALNVTVIFFAKVRFKIPTYVNVYIPVEINVGPESENVEGERI